MAKETVSLAELHKLALEFEALARFYRSQRTGQFALWEPYIVGEKLCKGLAEVCRGLANSDRTRRQDREITSKLRVLRTLLRKSVKS